MRSLIAGERNRLGITARTLIAAVDPRKEMIEIFWRLIVGTFIVMLLSLAVRAQEIDSGWPRTIQSDRLQIQVYQPQVDQWEGGKLQDRVAVAVVDGATGQTTYGTRLAFR
jgi:protein tyrosine phosphatase